MSTPNEEACSALIPVTILGSRWLRGGNNGCLLRSGKMCCLGFCALVLNHTEDELCGCEMPHELGPKIEPFPAPMIEFYSTRGDSLPYVAAAYNDSNEISDQARIELLVPVLEKLGFSPTFDLDH